MFNPGTQHFNFSNGAVIVDYSDLEAPGTLVSSLNNNPAAVLS